MSLSAKAIEQLKKKPGRYIDSGSAGVKGLYLQVRPGGASWLLRYEITVPPKPNGKTWLERQGRCERWMGLGSLADFSLKEARARAKAKRQLLADGIDPLEQKKTDQEARALAASKAITFAEAAQACFETREKDWRSAKHRAQFLSTLEEYANPIIGKLPVAGIETGAVLKVLQQKHKNYPGQKLWEAIPETANRVRGRIELVLDWAAAGGYREGDNPARWEGRLKHLLPSRSKIKKVEHHAALPYKEVGQFMEEVRRREGTAALALQFTVLTAARTGEVTGATWSEVDLKEKVWTVPENRIKGGKEHRVPLTESTVAILKACPREDGNPYIFIGSGEGAGLSNMAMAQLLKRMGRDDITVHGFRSTFRDWAAERTNYPNHVVEMALAHAIGDRVEAAYRRGDLFAKRVRLMSDWARYCASPAIKSDDNVVSFRPGEKA